MTPRITMLKRERENLLKEYKNAKSRDKIDLLVRIMDIEAEMDFAKSTIPGKKRVSSS